MGYIKEVALFFRYKHSKWSQICTMPRNLSMRPAEFCLIGGPRNSRRILLWGIASGPRMPNSISQQFFSMGYSNLYSNDFTRRNYCSIVIDHIFKAFWGIAPFICRPLAFKVSCSLLSVTAKVSFR